MDAWDVLRVDAALKIRREASRVGGRVVVTGEALGCQLVEVDFHMVLQEPGLFEAAATDLTAVLKGVLVFPHVTFEEPGLAEGLAAHLTGKFTRRLPLIARPCWGFLPRAQICSYVCHFHVPDQLLLVRGGKVTQGAFVGFVEDPDVALQLLLLPELSFAEGAAEAAGLSLEGLLQNACHLGEGGCAGLQICCSRAAEEQGFCWDGSQVLLLDQ